MARNTPKPYQTRLKQIPRRYACTQWQDLQHRHSRESETRKRLRLEASVYYPVVEGTHRDLSPLNNISHYFTVDRVKAAIRLINDEAGPGIDGITLDQYLQSANLEGLVQRVRSGRYQPKPVLRVEIPKQGGGKPRPLGIPTVEDRIVQRTWLLIVEQVFERMFLSCSYGYRPERNCHQALTGIANEVAEGNVWVLDADISKYFDSVSHDLLLSVIRRYITDPIFLGFCRRTLKADVMVKGKLEKVSKGTPQGGVISPLFANLFAHVVIDTFFYEEVVHQLSGPAQLFRYADDFVVLTRSKDDAENAKALIEQQLWEWGLTLHPDKTFIRNMACPGTHPPTDDKDPRRLVFLGYEISWQKTTYGKWEVVGRTAPGRVERALERWHQSIQELLPGSNKKPNWHSHRRRISVSDLPARLELSVWNHVCGFASYYCTEWNEDELNRYEEAVFRDAATFWKRHIDPIGENPYEDSPERIWAMISLKPIRELSDHARTDLPTRKAAMAKETT